MRICHYLVLLITGVCQAQFQYTGNVRAQDSGQPLSFASIRTDDGSMTLSDINGNFVLNSASPLVSFTTTYLGYESVETTLISNLRFYVVSLAPKNHQKTETVLWSKKKAAEIIKKVIEKKPLNDPQKKLQTFEFKAYNRLVITANPDSIDGRIDTLFYKKSKKGRNFKIDSSSFKFKKIIAKQHLFQTERISQFQYRGKQLKETIIGTKMAGFKQPIYEILSVNLQSFSIYDPLYELLETSYKSPLSPSFFQDYQFQLLDSTSIEGRQSYIVHFKNRRNSKKSGLEGVLYIDQEHAAVNKAIMRTRGLLDISGTHEFRYYPEEQLWFPSRKVFSISKGRNNYDIRILGETLVFDSGENPKNTRKKGASDYTYLLSDSSIFDVVYRNAVNIKNPFQRMEVQEDAENRKDSFWNEFRTEPLDKRGQYTYVALDSLASRNKFEKRLFQGRKILNGYMPFGFFDLDLRDLISFNNYEGFRFGIGGKTSDTFSRDFRIDGYTAYGTKDGRYKYNLGIAARLEKQSNSWLGGSYTDDIREIASSTFAIDKRNFKLYDPRPFNLKTFYALRSWRAYFESKLIPKAEGVCQIMYSQIDPLFEYKYLLQDHVYTRFTMATAQVSLQWNPFSDYLQTEQGRFEVKKRFPRFTFQYTQSLANFMKNDFTFSKIDFRMEYEKNHLNGHKSSLLFESGYATGEIPLTHVYNTSPNNLTNDRLIGRITIAGKNSFETMFFNEFFSSEFAMVHVKHSFRRMELFRKVRPVFVLVTRAAWGDMKNRERHIGLEFNTLEKGYYESGFELNQIYSGFGLTAFYRYGPYHLPRTEDNLAIKLSFILNLGF